MILTMDDIAKSLRPAEAVQKTAFTAEAAGIWHSSLYLAGRPGAAVAPAPGVNGAALTSYAGQIPVPAAVAGKSVYLAGFDASASVGLVAAMLADRLWHNSGLVVTTTGAQPIAHPGLPTRDMDGATAGRGVMLAIEVSTVTGNGAPVTTITASYTNSAGVAGRTATIANFPTSAVAGTFVPFDLAAGDVGVRSVESISFGTSLVSGAIHLVQYRPIDASLPVASGGVPTRLGPFDLGLPLLYDQSVPWLVLMPSATAAGALYATLTYAQG